MNMHVQRGAGLRAQREALGLSVRDAARAIGVSTWDLKAAERGKLGGYNAASRQTIYGKLDQWYAGQPPIESSTVRHEQLHPSEEMEPTVAALGPQRERLPWGRIAGAAGAVIVVLLGGIAISAGGDDAGSTEGERAGPLSACVEAFNDAIGDPSSKPGGYWASFSNDVNNAYDGFVAKADDGCILGFRTDASSGAFNVFAGDPDDGFELQGGMPNSNEIAREGADDYSDATFDSAGALLG